MFVIAKRNNLKLFLITSLVFILYFTFNINYYKSNISSYKIDDVLLVEEKKETYYIVRNEDELYLLYSNDLEFSEGNKVYFKGELTKLEDNYNSFYKYLRKKGINYELRYDKAYIEDNSLKFNDEIVNRLLENKSEKSKSYLKLILFNVKDENNEDFYNTFSIYSLTYLIAVSGFHINILLAFFKKIFKNNKIGYVIVGFYLYLLDFSVSSYRAYLCNIFKKVNKKMDFNLSNIDVVCLIGSVFIINNPSIMFEYSFIFSFLVSFVLEIFKLYSKKRIVLSFYIYLINIPLILMNYYKLNLSTLLFASIFSYPISFLYIFSFIFLFLDKFYLMYEVVINLFFKLFEFLDKFNVILVFGKPSVIFIILYYFILLCFFIFKERKRKIRFAYIGIILMLLFYQYSKPLLNSNESFYFLNVGQGDCMVFMVPSSKEVVLVDTGGSKYRDVATKEIIPFLESKGINKIRKVILSHDDFDHVGALDSLKSNFVVEEVIDTSLIESVMIGNKEFINLNVSDKRDNEGSLVLYGNYASYNLLLMGDAGVEVEEKIIDKVGNVDILKVGHHGSNTSSSEEFLREINAKIAIISVGKNNSYGHPHEEVLKSLEKYNYMILRSDENDDIGFGKNIFNLSFIDYFK